MLKLLLLVTWRNLSRDKLTSFIQLFGLVIGIACFVIIQLYVEHQSSYNQLFSEAESTYRINLIRDENKPQTLTPLRLSGELKDNFDSIVDTTRISAGDVSVTQQQSVYSERGLFVDDNFFDVFDFQLIEGDVLTALSAPNSIVLYEDTAVKYFGRSQGVLGSRLTINGNDFQVTGVIRKTSSPHTVPLSILMPMDNFYSQLPNEAWQVRWNFNATITFAQIKQGTVISDLATKVSTYYDERAKGTSSFKSYKVEIEPLLDIYLNNNVTRALTPPGSETMVSVFRIISLLILVLACVNFTNLSTAAAMRRGKDVGVRKALGASRGQLIGQYLTEALLITGIASLLAVLAAELLLPSFNQLMGVTLVLELTPSFLVGLFSLTVVVGLVAGGYPAFYLSNLSPAHVLKGLVVSSQSGVLLRQFLIVLQFFIAAFLVVSSLVVNWQMQFVRDMPQGFDRENVIVVSRGADIYNRFKIQAERHPDVMSVTMSHTVPTKDTRTSNIVRRADDIQNEIWVGSNPVSYDFFKTYGIKLLTGRDFSTAYVNDAYREDESNWQNSQGKIIINQTLATSLGWSPEEALGQMITLGGGGGDGLHSHQIIGVTEDSHYINAKNAVPPMIYVLSEQPQDLSLRWTSIRLKAGSSLQSVKELERMWLGLNSGRAFKYNWVTDLFSASYRNENLQTQLLNVFTTLAIVVTAIGLFGLAAFNTQRRVKEIAVRKVIGASTSQLCFMLVNQFSTLVLIANLIALPVAYFLMRDWLDGFSYRIDMPYFAFLASAVLSLFVAYLTVSVIAFRAATAKPVDSLSCE